MLDSKTFELRDRHTFIPIVAVLMKPGNTQDHYLLRRAGFTDEHTTYVIMSRMDCAETQYDPNAWSNKRTYTTAHEYICDHWNELQSGAVIDVEFILGEVTQPKVSERYTYG